MFELQKETYEVKEDFISVKSQKDSQNSRTILILVVSLTHN